MRQILSRLLKSKHRDERFFGWKITLRSCVSRYLINDGCFSILDRLPKANYTLLSHLICALHHVARRSKHNLMCASNLGVCCGPSLLWSPNPSVNQSRAIPTLTEMLIRHCEVLFGEGVTQLLGEERSDSGAEESTDSLHCKYFASTHSFFLFLSSV